MVNLVNLIDMHDNILRGIIKGWVLKASTSTPVQQIK